MSKHTPDIRISVPPLPDPYVDYLKSIYLSVQIINGCARPVLVESIALRFQTNLTVPAPDLTIRHDCHGVMVEPERMEYLNVKVTPGLVYRPYTNVFDVTVTYRRQEKTRRGARRTQSKPSGESSYLIIRPAPRIFGNLFISYKEPEDLDLAKLFFALAEYAGYTPYIAPADMKPGSRIWQEKIPQAITASKAAFVLWTSKTPLGTGVQKEIKICRKSKVPDILLIEEGVDPPAEYQGSDIEWTRFARNNAPVVFANVIQSYREM